MEKRMYCGFDWPAQNQDMDTKKCQQIEANYRQLKSRILTPLIIIMFKKISNHAIRMVENVYNLPSVKKDEQQLVCFMKLGEATSSMC